MLALRRLHPVTYAVALLAAAVLVVCNLGGDRDELAWHKGELAERCTHGWPATYVVRIYETHSMTIGDGYEGPTQIDVWSLESDVVEFRSAALALNVAVALALIIAAAAVCQRLVRRRFQFRLKQLLLLICAAALLLGWYAWQSRRYDRQQRVAERIRLADGKLCMQPGLPDWLRELPGFGSVRVFDELIVADDWGASSEFADILRDCEPLGSLRVLRLRGSNVSDEMLACVGRLRSLEVLSVSDAPIDELRRHLARRNRLELHQFNENSLRHLRTLKALQELRLQDCPVTGRGLQHLRGLTSLKKLGLWDSPITSPDLRHLVGLTNLESLDLQGTEVDDTAIPHLARLQGLKTLWLHDTKFTPAGIKKLKALMPQTRIYGD